MALQHELSFVVVFFGTILSLEESVKNAWGHNECDDGNDEYGAKHIQGILKGN